jgi:geranylgeranyl pyrophosphate synthase
VFELGKKDDFSEILALLSLKETITNIQDTFNYYSNICKEELNKMPDNRYKEALYDIVINLDSRLT